MITHLAAVRVSRLGHGLDRAQRTPPGFIESKATLIQRQCMGGQRVPRGRTLEIRRGDPLSSIGNQCLRVRTLFEAGEELSERI